MPAAIRILRGEDRGKIFTFPPQANFTIGRDEEADLPLYDALLSSIHLQVENDPETGELRLVDLVQNKRKVYVNKEPVFGEYPLREGDKIRVGGSVLEVLPRAVRLTPGQSQEATSCYRCGAAIAGGDPALRIHAFQFCLRCVDRRLESCSELGRYHIIKKLSKSSFEISYLAEDTEEGQLVNLRLMRTEKLKDRRVSRRFLSKAVYGLTIDHPNFLRFPDMGRVNGILYMASEHVPWRSIEEKLQGGTRYGLPDAMYILLQFLDILTFARERQVLLGWPVTERIVVDDEKWIKVTNFWLTREREEVIAFQLSPKRFKEVFQGEWKKEIRRKEARYLFGEEATEATIRDEADYIFPMGAFLFQLMTGRLPRQEDTYREKLNQLLAESPDNYTPTRLPPLVGKVLGKTLARDAKDRYHTFRALKRDLRQAYINLLG